MMSYNTPRAFRSFAGARAWLRNAFAAAALAGFAAACASAPQTSVVNAPPPPPEPTAIVEPTIVPFRPDRAPRPADTGVTPPHMEGRPIVRAALLLPFSHSNEAVRREAESMLNAAELALFERGGDQLLMTPKDDAGTRAGGEAATRAALAEGADVILGPLFAQAVTGAANAARPAGIPVIAFSTDTSVAGQGAYLLSFAPERGVRRAAQYAASRGARAIAVLARDDALGRRVAEVLRQDAERGGLTLHDALFYPGDNVEQATIAIERLAAAHAAGAFDAIYISDTPEALRELSAVLQRSGLTARDLTVLGPDSWRTNPAAATVAALDGAYVAGSDQSEHAAFAAAYRAAYGESPTELASLAYDAVALASQLRGDAEDWDIVENPNGYVGADGLFRLPPDGVAERGLAIYQLSPAGAFVVDPAPGRFDPQVAF
jgi:ABC-type branched-subunit amino acid transport system substrate-binding protein